MRIPGFKNGIICLLSMCSIWCSPNVGAQTKEDEVRELLLRYAWITYSGQNRPQLLAGQLPADLAGTLSLPSGSRIIGTIGQTPEATVSIIEISLAPDEAERLIIDSLKTQGWELRPPRGEFAHHMVLCRAQPPSSLSVDKRQLADSLTEVRLRYGAVHDFNCRDNEVVASADLLPRLTHPAKARYYSGGGGGSLADSYKNIILQTDLSAAELIAHYAEQLDTAGWNRVDEERSNRFHYSEWTLKDSRNQTWNGLLWVVQSKTPNYGTLVYVRVYRTSEAKG